MQVLFLAVHDPKPEHLADLVGAMAALGRTLDRTPGVVSVSTWRDVERVVAMSTWASPEALVAARRMGAAIADVPFDAWEARPRELYVLDAFAAPIEAGGDRPA